MDDRGVEDDGIGEPQPGLGAAQGESGGAGGVEVHHDGGRAPGGLGLLQSADPSRADEALGQGEGVEQEHLTLDVETDPGGVGVVVIARFGEGDEEAGVGHDHAGQSSPRS